MQNISIQNKQGTNRYQDTKKYIAFTLSVDADMAAGRCNDIDMDDYTDEMAAEFGISTKKAAQYINRFQTIEEDFDFDY